MRWYRDVCTFSVAWLAKYMARRPWGERFIYEVLLRAQASRWVYRARLLPSVWWIVLKRGPGLLVNGMTNFLDLQQEQAGGAR